MSQLSQSDIRAVKKRRHSNLGPRWSAFSLAKRLKRSNILVPRPRGLKVEAKYKQGEIVLSPTSGGGSGGATGFNGANDGVAMLLNNIRQGAADGERIGKKYLIKNISYQYQVDAGSTAPLTVACKWGLILDKQVNGTFITLTDAFDTASNKIDQLIKIDNMSKFKVLTRTLFHTSSNALDGEEFNSTRYGSGFLNFAGRKEGGIPVQCYNTDNGTVADIQSGAIYFFLFANIANADHYFNLRYRIKYIDV